METLDIKSIARLDKRIEARTLLLDLLDAGKSDGAFYLNSIKTAIEMNNYVLQEAKELLEKDVKLFRGYDSHVSSFVSMFSR